MPAGGDGHGWGRSVRGGRCVGGGGGPGWRCGGRCPPVPEPPVRPGTRRGAHSGGPVPLHGAPLPAVPGAEGLAVLPGCFCRMLGPRHAAGSGNPCPIAAAAPRSALCPGRRRGAGSWQELRSRPRSSFVYPTASCCGRRGCRVRRDRRPSSQHAPGQGMLLSPWRGCGCTARAAHAALWGLRSEQGNRGYSCDIIQTQNKNYIEKT